MAHENDVIGGVAVSAVLEAVHAHFPTLKELDPPIFLGGSLIEGYGNSTSDIDVLVIAPASTAGEISPNLTEPGGAIFSFPVGSRRVDVELRDPESLNRVLNVLQQYADGDEPSPHAIPPAMLELLNDIVVGRVISGQALFEEIRGRLDVGTLCHHLARRFSSIASGVIEDSVGAIKGRDVPNAMISSHAALSLAADAFLASQGATNPKAKWRGRRFEQVGLADELERYLRIDNGGGPDPDEQIMSARQRVLLAQEYIAKTVHR